MIDRTVLRLSALRALLGQTHPSIRLVKVNSVGNKIKLFFISDGSECDKLKEIMSEVASEIISDFPESDIEEILLPEHGDLPQEGSISEGWIYRRYEPI